MNKIGLALIALTLWAYSSVWSAAFVFEDSLSLSYANRPITDWTWRYINAPGPSHLLNLSLHLMLAACVIAFVARLGVRGLGLWVTAALWLVHPLNVETAAYAASRGELLAAIGVVSACVVALGDWWKPSQIALIWACLVIAALCKESGVVGLALVPLTIGLMGREGPYARWWPALGSACLLSAGIWFKGGLRAVANLGTTDFVQATSVTWQDWIGLQAAAAHHWIGSFVWLSGLTPDADVDAIPLAGRHMSLGLLAGLAAGAVWLWRRSPVLSFGLAWCLVALLPRFVVQTPQSYLNAHQFTVPLIGLVLITSVAAERWEQAMA